LIELKKYNSKNSPYQFHVKILSDVELSSNSEQAQRETIFIKDICNYALEHDIDILFKLSEINDVCMPERAVLIKKLY
jgi:hypothetical protein